MEGNTTVASDTWQIGTTGRVIVSVILGAIILIGIIGNVLLIVLIALAKKLHSVVNLCLTCLAVVDLMVLVFFPITNWLNLNGKDHSSLGRNLCCFLGFMDRPVVVCSVLIFLLIGLERYTLVCHPLKSLGWWTRKKVCLALVFIFVISAGLGAPFGIVIRYEEVFIKDNVTKTFCYIPWDINWTRHYYTALVGVSFILPTPVLIWLYGKTIMSLKTKIPQRTDSRGSGGRGAAKSRSQAAMMLVVVLTVFVVCVLPRNLYVLIYFYAPNVSSTMNKETKFIVAWIVRTVLYVNHAANPMIYFLMTDSFPQAFKSVFCRCQKFDQGRGGSTRSPSVQATSA